MVLNEEKNKETRKKKLTESLHLTVKIARRSNYNIDLRKLRVNKFTGPAAGVDKTRNTEHGTRNTEHGTRNTEHSGTSRNMTK